MKPFIVTRETKRMVIDNICFLLRNFLTCSEFETVIFCWVMDRQEIIDSILEHLDLSNIDFFLFTLTASECSLERHYGRDISMGLRNYDGYIESCKRLRLYDDIDSIKIDVSEISAKEVARVIAAKIE